MLTRLDLSDQQMTVQANAVLKVLGRSTLFILDILLRESVQNSLDAAKESGTGYVTFEFDIIRFNNHDDLLERLEFLQQGEPDELYNRLTNRFRLGDPVILVLSDKGTTGLSGPVRRDDGNWRSFQGRRNFENLIYQLGLNHGASKAGGSYGFGKSILYRLSPAGLAVFYSRTEEGERLIFSMISVEENIKSEDSTGIAWWGEVYEHDRHRFSAPVEDPGKIGEILTKLGLSDKRLPEKETGTVICIIAPQLQYLLNTEQESHEDSSETGPVNIDTKIELIQKQVSQSIQKWYWPRMTITDEVNPAGILKPLKFINCKEEVRLATQYIAMGNLLRAVENQNKGFSDPYQSCMVESIIHSYGSVTLGALAYQVIEQKADMEHLNKISMIRWPRMVVFEIPVQERPNRSVAALFLVNSNAVVSSNKNSSASQQLDDVFKDCESATHSEWNYQDMNPEKGWFKSYVRAAREKTVKAIYEALNPVVKTSAEAEFSPSAKVLGQLLLGSGGGVVQTFNSNSNGGGGSSNGPSVTPTLEVGPPQYLQNGDLHFELLANRITLGKYIIDLLARGGNQSLNNREWKRSLGNEFPFRIVDFKSAEAFGMRVSEESEISFSYAGDQQISVPVSLTIHPVKRDALISFSILKVNE